MPKKIVRFIHWNKEEAKQKAILITSAGYKVRYQTPQGSDGIRSLFTDLPAAFVIDLSRLPSQGRDLGIMLRKNKSTRTIPMIYVGGEPGKVRIIKKVLPDAWYSEWSTIQPVIEHALQNAPENPVIPESVFAGYSGKSLVQKLGITAGMQVGLIRAADTFIHLLGTLPDGVTLDRTGKKRCALLLWFVRSRQELESKIVKIVQRQDYTALWIIWPKKSPANKSDLSQQIIRRSGLTSGLVDYKICAVDKTWSGLLFTHRKENRRTS
jgi:hypothetical protein